MPLVIDRMQCAHNIWFVIKNICLHSFLTLQSYLFLLVFIFSCHFHSITSLRTPTAPRPLTIANASALWPCCGKWAKLRWVGFDHDGISIKVSKWTYPSFHHVSPFDASMKQNNSRCCKPQAEGKSDGDLTVVRLRDARNFHLLPHSLKRWHNIAIHIYIILYILYIMLFICSTSIHTEYYPWKIHRESTVSW